MTIDEAAFEALKREAEALRRRVAELESRLGERDAPEDELSRYTRQIPYRTLFEALPIGMSVYRADGLEIAINPANCKQAGVKPEQIIGKHNLLRNPQSIEKGFTTSFQRALEDETVTMPPTLYDTTQSGIELDEHARAFWTQTTYVPFDDESGARFVAEVNLDVSEEQRLARQAAERGDLLNAILDNSPFVMFVKDREGRYLLANRRTQELMGMPAEQIAGKRDEDIFPEELAGVSRAVEQRAMEQRMTISYEEQVPTTAGDLELYTVKFPLIDAAGEVVGLCGICTDITERRRTERKNLELQEEMLRVREAALRALSTPLIPIAKGVLAMPLIGDIDSARAHQMLETLLHGVAQKRASVAILDVTGVTSAGPEVADALVQAARAVSLLGAQVILTGIQPAMAQTLTNLDFKLSDIVTRSTLEDGIAYAMRMRWR